MSQFSPYWYILNIALLGLILLLLFALRKMKFQNDNNLKQLTAIFHMNPVGLILADVDGHIVDLNPSISALSGYPIEQLLDLHISTIFSSEYEHDDLSAFSSYLAYLNLEPGKSPQKINGLNIEGTTQSLLVDINEYMREDDLYYLLSIRDISKDVELKNELQQTHATVDIRVEERTSELQEDNVALKMEIEQRKLAEKKRDQSIADLKIALDEIKILNGLIPICASCKKVRDDTGFWEQIEGYIKKNSEANFSHSICPDCHETLYPELR